MRLDKSSGRSISLLLISFLFLLGCASTGYISRRKAETRGEVVVAEGEVVMDKKDIIGTKKRALVEAQKRAVEMVVGVYVSGRILVEKAITVKDRIISKTEGYIDSYKILSESQKGDLYKVKIKALVRITQINEDLGELGLLEFSPIAGNLRIGIWIEESIDGKSQSGRVSSDVVTQHLLDKGYQVVGSSGASQGLAKGDITGDLLKVFDADILIVGNAESQHFTEERLGGFISYRASIRLKAIKSSNSEVLLTLNKKASGVDVTKDMAGLTALTNVARIAGDELASRLAEEWNKRYSIRLEISGLESLNQLSDFKKSIEKNLKVDGISTRQFQPVAILDVYLTEGEKEEFIEYLGKQSGIKVKSMGSGVIEIAF